MKWISVKDYLPSNEDSILIFNDSHIKFGYHDGIYGFQDMTRTDEYGNYLDAPEVTHWMPLPDPPSM